MTARIYWSFATLALALLAIVYLHDENPPLALPQPHQFQVFNLTLTDHFYWLRESESMAVRDYIEAENKYSEGSFSSSLRI